MLLLCISCMMLYMSTAWEYCRSHNQSFLLFVVAVIKVKMVTFEVFTPVTMKNAYFRDVAPCRSCVNRRFGGTHRLHLQGRKISERGTSVSRWLQIAATQDLHGPTSQKTAFFKVKIILWYYNFYFSTFFLIGRGDFDSSYYGHYLFCQYVSVHIGNITEEYCVCLYWCLWWGRVKAPNYGQRGFLEVAAALR
jgi:hypothetical protein